MSINIPGIYQIPTKYTSLKNVYPPAAGLFSRFRPRVMQQGACVYVQCTPRRKCGSWPDFVACALGLQSRENWQITAGSHSDLLEPSRPMEPPQPSTGAGGRGVLDTTVVSTRGKGLCTQPFEFCCTPRIRHAAQLEPGM